MGILEQSSRIRKISSKRENLEKLGMELRTFGLFESMKILSAEMNHTMSQKKFTYQFHAGAKK